MDLESDARVIKIKTEIIKALLHLEAEDGEITIHEENQALSELLNNNLRGLRKKSNEN